MKRLIVAAVAACTAVLVAPCATAATLGEIAAALAAPAASPQPTNDWSAFSKLKGTQWKGKAPQRGGNQYYWNANLPLDGLGTGELALVGTQKNVTSATAGVQKKIELPKIQQAVTSQFPANTKIEQVRGACPGEASGGSRIYRVTLAGRKPLYLHAQSVSDDKSGDYTSFEMEPQRNKGWIC